MLSCGIILAKKAFPLGDRRALPAVFCRLFVFVAETAPCIWMPRKNRKSASRAAVCCRTGGFLGLLAFLPRQRVCRRGMPGVFSACSFFCRVSGFAEKGCQRFSRLARFFAASAGLQKRDASGFLGLLAFLPRQQICRGRGRHRTFFAKRHTEKHRAACPVYRTFVNRDGRLGACVRKAGCNAINAMIASGAFRPSY